MTHFFPDSPIKAPTSQLTLHDRRDPLFIKDNESIELSHFYIPAHYKSSLDSLLVTHGMIVDRVEKLAYDIVRDYSGNTIHILCVLKGQSLILIFEPNIILLL